MRRLAAFGAIAALAAPVLAGADTIYRYETESGSIAFTDDRERVPKLYRDGARAIEAESLFDYERTTIAQAGARRAAAPAAALVEEEAPPVAALTRADLIALDLAPGVRIEVSEGPTAEPIRVDHEVLRWDEGRLWRFTIIRRGDEVLAEIREDCCP